VSSQWRADLQALHSLLEQYAESLADGDADSLPVLGQSLRQILSRVAHSCAGPQLPPEGRTLLAQLSTRAQRLQLMLARRAQQVEACLCALGASHEGLRDHQVSRTYGATGAMSSTAMHMRGFDRA